MYQNIKDLQEEIDNFTPKNIIDYILHGSQLNRWFKSIKNNKDNN